MKSSHSRAVASVESHSEDPGEGQASHYHVRELRGSYVQPRPTVPTMLFSLLGSLFLILRPVACRSNFPQAKPQAALFDHPRDEYVKVPITLGVMSRCPDALFCENVFDTVMSHVGKERVEVDLAFIAT